MREGGNIPIPGVIAITPTLIEKVLAITGPIQVPEYPETITADNLIACIHYYQLSSKYANKLSDPVSSVDIHSLECKRFIALLAEYFLKRIKQLPAQDSLKLMQTAISAIHSKDIQIYLHNDAAKQMLQLLHLSSAIQTPVGDDLMVVSARCTVSIFKFPCEYPLFFRHGLFPLLIISRISHPSPLDQSWASSTSLQRGKAIGHVIGRLITLTYALIRQDHETPSHLAPGVHAT